MGKVYCDFCSIIVSPQDREQVRVGKKVFHSVCFKKHIKDKMGGKLKVQEVIHDSDVLERQILSRNEWPN